MAFMNVVSVGGKSAVKKCYEYFNTHGNLNGNCGILLNGTYQKCDTP